MSVYQSTDLTAGLGACSATLCHRFEAEADADSGLGTPTTNSSLFAESSPSPSLSSMSLGTSGAAGRDTALAIIDSASSEDEDEESNRDEADFETDLILTRRHAINRKRDLSSLNSRRILDREALSWQQMDIPTQQQRQPQLPRLAQQRLASRPAMAAASVPMRCRHLPPSIWLEPNVPLYSPALPPLDLAGHSSSKSFATCGKLSPTAKSPTATSSPTPGASEATIFVCSAMDSEDSLRRLFDVAAVRGNGAAGSPGSVTAARQSSGLLVAHLNTGSNSDCCQASVRPPKPIRRRFVCGRDPRLSDNSPGSVGCGIGSGALGGRRLPPLDLSSLNGGGLNTLNGSSAAQLLGEVASWL